MANTVDKVISIATAEVGYLEKETNKYLDHKTKNAGDENYTKYWAFLKPSWQKQPWCNAFLNWCFVKAYGESAAKKLLCTPGEWSYYTPTSANYFKKKDQWKSKSSTPKVGDVIFFKNTVRINHVGLVYKVDSERVYTIEGNTSGSSGVVANGGGVFKKSYSRSYSKIAGYGRPKYDVITSTYTKTQFIKDVQKACGAEVDGIAGSETLSKTITVSATVNRKHAVVKAIQKRLNALGYSCGDADGIAGAKFTAAVNKYQDKVLGYDNCDGEITAKGKMWKSLLGML